MPEIVNGPVDDFVLHHSQGVMEDKGRGPSTAMGGTFTLDPGLEGLSPDQLPKWSEVFLPYENLATKPEVAERALAYVREVKRNYWEKTQRIRKRWSTLQYLLKGNTLHNWRDPYAVHSPQLYLAEETVVPRMEEAVMGEPRWFSVEGATDADRKREEKIRAFIMSQLEAADWEDLNQPIFRTFYEYAFCAIKEQWAFDTQHIIDRHPKKIEQDDKPPRFEFRLEEKEVITFQGPRYHICEPEGFLVDPTRRDAHEGSYIGDQSKWYYDDVAALGERGVFENWREIRSEPPKEDEGFSNYLKSVRSLTDNTYLERRTEEGAPHEVWLTDLWCRFDLFNTGRTRECVITVANDRTVLRVQENPFDDKHRPYSVATYSKNPFEFFGVGPLDRAIPAQIELDRIRDLGIRSAELSSCPVAIVDSSSDFPDTLAGIRPGSVLRGKKPEWMQVKPVMNESLSWEERLKGEIQALTASPDILTGMEDDPTATGTMKRIEEANKRLKGFVSAYSTLANQMLQHTHAMNKQFVTQRMQFKAIGAEAQGLRDYEWIGPDELQWEVRFKFRAIQNLKTLGMRQSRLMQWMQTFMPLVQADPTRVNIGKLLVHSAKLYLGEGPEMAFIKQDTDPAELLDQFTELLLLQDGAYVPVHAEDDHEQHLAILEEFMRSDEADELHPSIRSLVDEHEAMHLNAISKLEVQRGATQAPGFLNQGGIAIAGQGSAPGRTNQPGPAMPAFQLPGQTLNEQPGPSNQERMRTPGRNAPTPQEQNMGV